MSEIKLLDCTLRDGGYINDWEFGQDNIVNVFERLVSSEVDIIEVGFLDQRRQFDRNRTIMPNTEAINTIFDKLEKGNSLIVGMIDFGTCGIENIMPCEECFLDGIRVIFKKENMYKAIMFCGQIKALGYKVFVQAVSITSYSDEEMMQLLELVNELEPYAFSLVDTYGLLHKNMLMHYFNLADENMKSSIGLGYHSHNNFQLAYSNCIEVLESTLHKRMLLVDGTLYGMGKGAGNAPIELLSMYMNENLSKNYHISQMLEAIEVSILNIYKLIPWGYTFKFYISASKDCHPNYVTYLMEKKSLSIKSINDILSNLEGEKKLLYDQKYIENLYVDYQKIDCNDEYYLNKLKLELSGKSILLLAPGNSIVSERDIINNYIKEKLPLIIAVNFLPEGYPVEIIFVSNSKRYLQLSSCLSSSDVSVELIATSNVTKTKGNFDYTLRYSDLLDEEAHIVDNPLIMLLKLFKDFKLTEVALAGFDGFQIAETPNYINPNMEHSFTKQRALEINQDVIESMSRLSIPYPVTFITKSYYGKC